VANKTQSKAIGPLMQYRLDVPDFDVRVWECRDAFGASWWHSNMLTVEGGWVGCPYGDGEVQRSLRKAKEDAVRRYYWYRRIRKPKRVRWIKSEMPDPESERQPSPKLVGLVEGRHMTDADVDGLVADGHDEDAVLQALADDGHTIGRTTDGRNEWWPKDTPSAVEQGNL